MNVDVLFSSFPVLRTEALTLRELRTDDAPALFSIYSNPEVTQYIDAEIHRTVADTEAFIQKQKTLFENRQGICWGIFDEQKDLIGLCRFYNVYPKHSFLSVGYELNRSYWGKGIMREALHRVLKYIFEEAEVNRVEAQTFAGNTRSVNLLEKFGFTGEGRLRVNFLINGKLRDSLIYSLLKSDYFNLSFH